MRSLLLLGTAPLILAMAGAAQAASLREALARTYTANPTINASRTCARDALMVGLAV